MVVRVHVGKHRKKTNIRPIKLPICGTLDNIRFNTMTIGQLGKKYAKNEHRKKLIRALRQYLNRLKKYGIHASKVSVMGSFLSNKKYPRDIDITILHKPDFDIPIEYFFDLNNMAEISNIDVIMVTNELHYCAWLSRERDRGSRNVVQLKGW